MAATRVAIQPSSSTRELELPWFEMVHQRATLRDLAGRTGFTVDSLAHVVSVNRSTLYRLWVDPEWVDKVGAKTLRRLIGVLPGVDEEVGATVLAERRSDLLQGLEALGQPVDEVSLDAAMDKVGVRPHFLYTGLEAVFHLLREERNEAVRCLRACWGREQTRALDVAFGTHPSHSAFADPKPVIAAAESAFDELLKQRGYSFPRVIAQAHLAHHIGKATGQIRLDADKQSGRRGIKDEKASFFIRGAHMGVLRQEDDLDTAGRYGRLVEDEGIARLVELWAFPSWTGDTPASDNFSLPGGVLLKNTAAEVITEIAEYNDAYVWYLVSTYVPVSLEQVDSTFGGQLAHLEAALRNRAERAELHEVAEACHALAKRIADGATLAQDEVVTPETDLLAKVKSGMLDSEKEL